MKKKLLLVLLLSAGIAVLSYGEVYLGTTLGFNYLSDIFLDEDYGRNMDGNNFLLSFHFFPTNASLGTFARVSHGNYYQGLEYKGDTDLSKLYSSVWDLRFSVAPSYRFRLGERVQIPVSLGPVFSFYGEDSDGYHYYYDDDLTSPKSTLYYAMNLGLTADGAIVISPAKKYFFIMGGLSFGLDFLHFEKGEMSTRYREFTSTRYKVAPYLGFNFSAYLGVGVSFDFD
jgi:hypothetical protein